MQKILFYNKFIKCLYIFRAYVLIIRRSKLYYTASVIITFCRWPSRAQIERVLTQPLHRTATCVHDDTRCCIIQFWPPDDEHIVLETVETWNELIVKQKFFALSALFTGIFINNWTRTEVIICKYCNIFSVNSLHPTIYASSLITSRLMI